MTTVVFDPIVEARKFLNRRDDGGGAAITGLTIEQAYDSQDAMNNILEKERGWKHIGYKIGATTAAMRQGLHLKEQFWGRLYREWTKLSPADYPFKPGLTHTVEVEIFVLLGRDLPASGGPYTADTIKAATKAIGPAFEICGGYANPAGPEGSPGLIADFAGNVGWVHGEEITNFANLDVLNAPIQAQIINGLQETGKGLDVDGGPFGSTAFLANALNKRGQMLRAGEYISTGTVVKPFPAAAAEKLTADFGALGKISVQL